MNKFIILLVLPIQLLSTLPTSDDLIVTLPNGQVKGAVYTTPTNKTYYGFRGIPYASPPVGNLRFEAPQPPKSWSGILDATNDGKACISVDYFIDPDAQSEDCLYINIYTPSLNPVEKLPVLFWIFGGGFISGNSSKSLYGPDNLIEEDVIVASINYRLGPFGFLSTGDLAILGNAGLKDQSLALQWIRENVEYLGGDPEKIIIFGQSAGAVSVGLHLLSNTSAGLFRGAILESSSALTPLTLGSNPRSYAFELAGAIPGGKYGNDTQKLKNFLLGCTVDELVTAGNSLPTGHQASPYIEVESESSFLTEYPYELLETGRFNKVPIIIGICAEESLMFLKDINSARLIALLFDAVPSSILPPDLYANSSDEGIVIEKIKSIYLQGNIKLFLPNLVSLANFLSDNIFTRGIIKHAELQATYTPVYFYQFAYYGRPITPAFIEGAEKASHASELPFLFNMEQYQSENTEDVLTQKRLVKLWTNFAKFLNPTPEKSELFENLLWPTFSSADYQFFNINNTLELKSHIKEDSYPGWNEIYETYGRKPFITY